MIGVQSKVTTLVGKSEARIDCRDRIKPSGKSGARSDPSNVAGLSQAVEAVLAGNAKYAAQDYAGAADQYRRAVQYQPKNPIGHLMCYKVKRGSGQPHFVRVLGIYANNELEAANDGGPGRLTAPDQDVYAWLRGATPVPAEYDNPVFAGLKAVCQQQSPRWTS